MLAVIGGSGLNQLSTLKVIDETVVATPYGESVKIRTGSFDEGGSKILFLPRHGDGHHLPPHLINYRANIWATKKMGATHVLAVNAVGGIRSDMAPGTLLVPDQIIDYTYGRDHTFFTGGVAGLDHIDFTEPFDGPWREKIIETAKLVGLSVVDGGVYGCSQGPRLETAAEIRKYQQDGCDVIGMTGMPEAALACEVALSYGALNLVVNWGAGLSDRPITMDMIVGELENGMKSVQSVLEATAKYFSV